MHERYFADTNMREGEPDNRHREAERDLRVKQLRPTNKSLADALADCRPRERCGLAVCPHCSRAYQGFMMEKIRELWPTESLTKATLIPAGLQPRNLGTRKLSSMKRHFMRIFERAKIDAPIVGFIDLSFNVHGGGKWEAHWQPHLEFVMPTEIWISIKEPLRLKLKTNATVTRPLRGVDIRDYDHQASYAFKPVPLRKSFFEATSPKARPSEQYLIQDQKLEFMLWLGDASPHDRAFLRGMKLNNSKLVMV